MAGRELGLRLPQFGDLALKVLARGEGARIGDAVSLGIRPEHFVEAEGAPVRLTARAQVIEQLGGVSYVYAAGEGETQITVQQRGHSRMPANSMVEFGIDPAACLVFDAEGKRV